MLAIQNKILPHQRTDIIEHSEHNLISFVIPLDVASYVLDTFTMLAVIVIIAANDCHDVVFHRKFPAGGIAGSSTGNSKQIAKIRAHLKFVICKERYHLGFFWYRRGIIGRKK